MTNVTTATLDLEGLDVADADGDRYAYTGMDLANTTDELELYVGATLIDAVANDLGNAWCAARGVYGGGDRGTPGAANDPC